MRQDAPMAPRSTGTRPWIPESTQRALGDSRPSAQTRDNLSLWLDCFSPFDEQGHLKGEARIRWLEHFAGPWQSEVGKDGLKALEGAVRTLHADAAGAPIRLIRLELTLQGRLLVGSGSASALETSLALHPLWSVPRIPASALKGLAHHALLRQRAQVEAEPPDPSTPEQRDLLGALAELERCLFGCAGEVKKESSKGSGQVSLTETAGILIFCDALPKDGRFELALDVLTPHANAYYQGNEPPADYWSPVPVSYLTVVKTTFVTWVGVLPPLPDPSAETQRDASCSQWPKAEQQEELLQLGVKLLETALREEGAGSRTRSGFGRFQISTQYEVKPVNTKEER